MANNEFQELRRFLGERFSQIDSRLEKMATKEEMGQRFEETRHYIDQHFEESKRHMGVLSEGLQHKIDLLAEGHQLLNQKIDNLSHELKVEIKETQAMIKFSYAELDRRVRTLEDIVLSLQARVERLEAHTT